MYVCVCVLIAAGRKVFREFLRSEYSEENMLFWLACEDLKSEQNPELVEEKARLIYEDYISILSPKEVSAVWARVAILSWTPSPMHADIERPWKIIYSP